MDGKIHLSYKGPWDEHMLFSIGNYIKLFTKDRPTASKKIFKVFMELAQNVCLHSAEYNKLEKSKRSGIGTMVISESGGYYYFYSGNVVSNVDIFPIIDKCEVINALDRKELREFKRKQRNLPFGEAGGGNIGLIQVALTSEYPLKIKLTPINDENSFFSICVKIKSK